VKRTTRTKEKERAKTTQKNQATFKCAPPLFYLKNAKHLLGFALLHFYLFSLQRSFSPLRPGFVLLLALSFNLFYIAASFSCATANAKSKPNAIQKKRWKGEDLA